MISFGVFDGRIRANRKESQVSAVDAAVRVVAVRPGRMERAAQMRNGGGGDGAGGKEGSGQNGGQGNGNGNGQGQGQGNGGASGGQAGQQGKGGGQGSGGGGVGGGGAGGGSGPNTVPADIPDGSDDDIVARQLREAAMNETDPELREKLWQEYRNYKKSTG